jgi:NTP pyrophosphatase (non-canonical NTP hydrolase)
MLSFEEYQRLAARTALYPGHDEEALSMYPALGLAGEAGEVCEHFKKALRDDGGTLTRERRAALRKEVGDVLWYVAAIATELDLSLAEIAQANLDKLASRMERGVLQGDGDDR